MAVVQGYTSGMATSPTTSAKSTAYTAAPWTIDGKEFVDEQEGTKIFHNGYHIGTWVDYENFAFNANARLIAAAPELLATLRQVLDAMKDGSISDTGSS